MRERTLVLLRHSKADRPVGVADINRPLTARGHADAAAAGVWLARHGYEPDLVLCSPSKRTRQTWHGVAVALPKGSDADVRYDAEVYDGEATDLLALTRTAGGKIRTILMIGHNPSISLLSAILDPTAGGDSDGLRTSGLAVHRLTGKWDELRAGAAKVTDTHTARG